MIARRDSPCEIDPELVQYLVVVVPDEAAATVVVESAAALALDRAVALLDVAVVARDLDGDVQVADAPLDRRSAPELPGLLCAEDLTLIGEEVPSDSVGVVIVVEDRWATSLAASARDVGGYVAGGDRIPAQRIGRPIHRVGIG